MSDCTGYVLDYYMVSKTRQHKLESDGLLPLITSYKKGGLRKKVKRREWRQSYNVWKYDREQSFLLIACALSLFILSLSIYEPVARAFATDPKYTI